MSFLKIRVKISQVLSFGLAFWVATYIFSFFYFGESPTGDIVTVIIGSTLAAVCFAAIQKFKDTLIFGPLAVLVFNLHVFGFPRIFQYLAVKQERMKQLYILFPMHWDAASINYGLYYFLLGIFAILAGLIWGEQLGKRVNHIPKWLNKSKLRILSSPSTNWSSLIFASIIIFLIEGYYTIYHGMSAASNCQQPNVRGVWLIHFFSGDLLFFVAAGYIMAMKSKSKYQKFTAMALLLAVYLTYTLLLGSRGGTLRILIVFFILAIALWDNFKIRLTSLALVFPILAVSSILLYHAGTAIRETHRYTCQDGGIIQGIEGDQFSKQVDEGQSDYLTNAKFTDKFKNSEDNKDKFDLPPKYARILDRMGTIDYAVGIASMQKDRAAFEKYMNFGHITKNIINNLVPGEPYPEAKEMTNNMMPIVYRGFDLKHVKENFLSEPWTIWGLGISYFGFIGGLVFIFIGATILQFFYCMIEKLSFDNYFLYRGFYLWIIASGCFFFVMSFDHAAIVILYGLLQLLVTIFLFGLGNRIFSGNSHIPQ